jgi:hypothetical protein
MLRTQENDMFRFIPLLAACALSPAALAQVIYKCSIESKVSYGDRPCSGGNTVELAVPPAPPQASARNTAAREREMLLQLEKLRLARALHEEREQARERRARASQSHKCDRLRLQRKWAVEDLARIPRERLEVARLKAQRQAEALAVECPA